MLNHFFSCFISNVGVFFGVFLGPIFLVIIFNTVVFILVICVLLKHKEDKKETSRNKSTVTFVEIFKFILSVCGIMVLLGLSWLFAAFTFISTTHDVAFTFQLIFTLLNSFQGFWIFFFVLLNAEARKLWLSLITSCCTYIDKERTMSINAAGITPSEKQNKYFSTPKVSSMASASSIESSKDKTTSQNEIIVIGVDSTNAAELNQMMILY